MEPMSPSKLKLSNLYDLNKRKLKIGGVIAVVSLLLSCTFYTAFKLLEDQYSSSYFTVVLDCGSTGTRVTVYQWLSRDVNPGELPVLRKSYPDSSALNEFRKGSCQYHCLQTKPGLDKFIGNVSGVRKSLEPLIKLAKQWVPAEKQKNTPIYVLATAGLRSVGKEDAGRVLDDVEVVLKDQEFYHTRRHIRVLSGKEEAYYGWVALNYKMGRLGNSSMLPTLGLLDLGGSSLQVALEGRKEINSNQGVSLRDTSIRNPDQVLSYSLEAFGLNAAFDRTVVMLSQEVEVTDISDGYKLKHPCLSSSVVQNYTCYDCFKLNLSDQKKSNKYAQPISVHMVGNPNWKDCIRLARAVATTNISISFPYSPSESPNSKVDSPSQTGEFRALEQLTAY